MFLFLFVFYQPLITCPTVCQHRRLTSTEVCLGSLGYLLGHRVCSRLGHLRLGIPPRPTNRPITRPPQIRGVVAHFTPAGRSFVFLCVPLCSLPPPQALVVMLCLSWLITSQRQAVPLCSFVFLCVPCLLPLIVVLSLSWWIGRKTSTVYNKG